MPQCQFLFSAVCFRKVTQEIFSELDATKTEVLIFPEHTRRTGEEPECGPGATTPWPGAAWPWPVPGGGVGPLAALWLCPFDYKICVSGKPSTPDPPSMKSSVAAAVADPRSGGFSSSSWYPAGEGNRHRRPSSSPCPPPEWCVSSPPLDYGSIAVARWLCSPPCAIMFRSCELPTWSRS
jgi:hypothetical protein